MRTTARLSRLDGFRPGTPSPTGLLDRTDDGRVAEGGRWRWRGAGGGDQLLRQGDEKEVTGLGMAGCARPTIQRGCESSRRARPARSNRRRTMRLGMEPETRARKVIVGRPGRPRARTSHLAGAREATPCRSAKRLRASNRPVLPRAHRGRTPRTEALHRLPHEPIAVSESTSSFQERPRRGRALLSLSIGNAAPAARSMIREGPVIPSLQWQQCGLGQPIEEHIMVDVVDQLGNLRVAVILLQFVEVGIADHGRIDR
jgi:hypothetical protein